MTKPTILKKDVYIAIGGESAINIRRKASENKKTFFSQNQTIYHTVNGDPVTYKDDSGNTLCLNLNDLT